MVCYLISLITLISLVGATTSASCCQNGQTPKTKEDWMNGVMELDRLHKIWLGKKILDSLNIRKIPENASRWKRNKFNTTTENEPDSNVDGETIRRYTLRVVGKQIGTIHHHQTSLNETKCSAHYIFNSNLPQTGYKTQMQNAAVELLSDASLNLHMNEGDRTMEVHHLDVDIVQGRKRTVDIGSLIFPFWSTTSGVVFSITVRSRQLCSITDSDEYEFYPILKLELRETMASRQTKRHLYRSGQNKRNNMIIDCEMAWDQGFLQNMSNALIDAVVPCCRRRVVLDFVQLGWENWVVAPLSFDSYYCIGRCSTFGGFASDSTDGPSFYTEIMNIQRRAYNSGLTACCSPVKFLPITITVMLADNELMTQTLEDVIVEQCGCM